MKLVLQSGIVNALGKDDEIEKVDEAVRLSLTTWLSSQMLECSPRVHEVWTPPEVAEASALYAAAKQHLENNMLVEGEESARLAVNLRVRVLGAAHDETRAGKLLLAAILKKQKKLDEAKPLYEDVLAAARQVLGDDHEETLACMNNLAVVLKQQGNLEDARALYEEALHFKRSKLGSLHSSTLTSMNNLAGLLKAQNRLDEARALYEESLQGHRTTLGSLHQDTLTDMWNFALFLNKATPAKYSCDAGVCI